MSEDVTRLLARQRAEACLSDYALDRLRLGELVGTPEENQRAAHVRKCPRCAQRMDELAAVRAPALDVARFAAGASPFAVAAPNRRRRRRLLLSLAGLAGASAAALFLVTWRAPVERSKGASWQLLPVVQHPNGRIERVSQEATLAPGDRMRFEVAAPSDGFVSVVSLDARGVVTAFAPPDGRALPVKAGRRLLAEAVLLDDALGPERLLLLACKQALPVEQIVASAQTELGKAKGNIAEVGTLPLPCRQTSFWFRKEKRP